jgi:hypothetical protein
MATDFCHTSGARIPILRVISLIGFLFLLISFVSAGILPEEQLLGRSQFPNLLTNLLPTQNNLENETPHTLVGSYYTLDENLDARLMLNNKGSVALEVSPTLYNLQGQELQLPPVTVAPQSFRFINLQDWAAIGGENFRSGNIKLFHYGKDLVLGAQIYLADNEHSLSFEEKFAELGKFDSHRQEAIWWMSSNQAEAKIVMTNTTGSPLTVTGRLAKKPHHVGGTETFLLAPHETKALDLRQDFPGSAAFINSDIIGLTLEHSAAKDALLARVMLKEEARGYSNVVQFSNPAGGKSSEYQGVGFQIENIAGQQLTPVIVLRNVGTQDAVVNARIPYTRTDGTKNTITLPQEDVKAGWMKLLNVQNIIQRAEQEQIKIASLEVEYDTSPGSILVAAHSVSTDGNQVFRVPIWDPFAQRSPTGGYPWRIEGSSVTETYIKNIADYEEDYVAFLVWENGGMYMIGLNAIAAHETVHIDVKKLRDEQIPDERGRKIPLSVSSGQLQWTLRRKDELPDGDARANLSLIGRSEQVDLIKGIANNYSCQNCCTGDFVDGRIEAADLSQDHQPLEVGSTRIYLAVEESKTCYGNHYDYGTDTHAVWNAVWGSSNPSIATVAGGHVTGQSPGDATITAAWYPYSSIIYPCGGGGGGGGGDTPLQTTGDGDEKCNETQKDDVKKLDTGDGDDPPPSLAACGTCQRRRWQSPFTPVKYVTVTGNNPPPTVAAIRAELPSTGIEPPGEFITANASTAFATNSNDLMVVFKASNSISIQAQGVYPANSVLKWKLDRDPSDPTTTTINFDTGLPTLSTSTGQVITITPNKVGNFRLICYFDANDSGSYDSGEELRVLKFVIVRIFISDTTQCRFENNNVFSEWGLPGTVAIKNNDVNIQCDVYLEGGGSVANLGLDKIKLGIVSNMIQDNGQINYVTGDCHVNSTGILLYPNSNNAFQQTSAAASINLPEGYGQVSRITAKEEPSTSIYDAMHPNNQSIWESVSGGYSIYEFVAAYSEVFPRHYVVMAKGDWQISFAGYRDKMGRWQPNGAFVNLLPMTYGPNAGNGTVQTGTAAAMAITGEHDHDVECSQ